MLKFTCTLLTTLLVTAFLANTVAAAAPPENASLSFTIVHAATDPLGIEAEILAALEAARSDDDSVAAPAATVGASGGNGPLPSSDDNVAPVSGDYTRCYYRSDNHYTCCTYYESGMTWCKEYRYECHYYGSGGYRYARGSVSSHCGWRAYDGYHDCGTHAK